MMMEGIAGDVGVVLDIKKNMLGWLMLDELEFAIGAER